ncbi:MAG: tRNA (adenosine(37)-N6)-dimethylallyltransferase MiaA [Treponema sp.]|nr:tRNA (adenosine(37)-N6)-dimethylallyltransferase MiaA [Treponema sp.]
MNQTSSFRPVIVIFAPTATGKTALAGELFGKDSLSAFKGRGEIVSADSEAVYRGFDIGSAKPTPEERNETPHHLIDIKDPSEQFTACSFTEEADAACREILGRGKIPVVMGGSGFYIKNFLTGPSLAPAAKPEIHAKMLELLEKNGKTAMHEVLLLVDPLSAQRINENDTYRTIRALDVFFSSGKPLSSYPVSDTPRKIFDFLVIVLTRDRDELFARIDARVDAMFEAGLYEEFLSLVNRGFNEETPAMKAIGYREFFKLTEGSTLGEVKSLIKKNSRIYAKKQITYMKQLSFAHYINADDKKGIADLIQSFLEKEGLLS